MMPRLQDFKENFHDNQYAQLAALPSSDCAEASQTQTHTCLSFQAGETCSFHSHSQTSQEVDKDLAETEDARQSSVKLLWDTGMLFLSPEICGKVYLDLLIKELD